MLGLCIDVTSKSLWKVFAADICFLVVEKGFHKHSKYFLAYIKDKQILLQQ